MSFVPGDIAAGEYEFFAENTIVMIVPNLSLPVLNLIHVRAHRGRAARACGAAALSRPACAAPSARPLAAELAVRAPAPRATLCASVVQGNFGPFRPLIPARAPLWFALALKKRQRCSIQLPAWLAVDELSRTLEAEKRGERFEDLPQHFFEVAHLLLESAREDIADAHRVEGLIEDLENKRHAKLRKQLAQPELGANGLLGVTRLEGLTPIEINRIRRFASGSLDMLLRLQPQGEAPTQPPAGGGLYGAQQAFVDDRQLEAALQRRQ